MRDITRDILNSFFSNEDEKRFEEFVNIIKNKPQDKEGHRIIWEYDQSIGGFGGYCAPLDININPYNRLNHERNVYRSLQYARIDMFMGVRPRHIIIDTALHVETLVKIVIASYKMYIHGSFNNREFGKNINYLKEIKYIDDALYKRLDTVRKLLNLAKHDTDSENDTTFDYMDSVVFYFECRMLGKILMSLYGNPCAYAKFDIVE